MRFTLKKRKGRGTAAVYAEERKLLLFTLKKESGVVYFF